MTYSIVHIQVQKGSTSPNLYPNLTSRRNVMSSDPYTNWNFLYRVWLVCVYGAIRWWCYHAFAFTVASDNGLRREAISMMMGVLSGKEGWDNLGPASDLEMVTGIAESATLKIVTRLTGSDSVLNFKVGHRSPHHIFVFVFCLGVTRLLLKSTQKV